MQAAKPLARRPADLSSGLLLSPWCCLMGTLRLHPHISSEPFWKISSLDDRKLNWFSDCNQIQVMP